MNFERACKSADQGDAKVDNCLGMVGYNGEGVTQDYKQRFEWFLMPTEQRHAESLDVDNIEYWEHNIYKTQLNLKKGRVCH